jgi:hypothetical protein
MNFNLIITKNLFSGDCQITGFKDISREEAIVIVSSRGTNDPAFFIFEDHWETTGSSSYTFSICKRPSWYNEGDVNWIE